MKIKVRYNDWFIEYMYYEYADILPTKTFTVCIILNSVRLPITIYPIRNIDNLIRLL